MVDRGSYERRGVDVNLFGILMSLTVEDVVEFCRKHTHDAEFLRMTSPWHVSFFNDIARQVIGKNRALTTSQAGIVLKVFPKIKAYLVSKGRISQDEADSFLQNPEYRLPPTQSSNVPREVRAVGGNRLAFRFKRNDTIRLAFDGLATILNHELPEWDWINKLTIVPVTPSNVEAVEKIIINNRFNIDLSAAETIAAAYNNEYRKVSASAFMEDGYIRIDAPNSLIDAWVANVLRGEEIGAQSYRLPATPQMARRIVPLKWFHDAGVKKYNNGPCVISADIDELALVDTVDVSIPRYDVVQQLLDYDLRATIDSSGELELVSAIGHAIRLAGIKWVFVENEAWGNYFIVDGKVDPSSIRVVDSSVDIGKYRDEAVYITTNSDSYISDFFHTIVISRYAASIKLYDFPTLNEISNSSHLFNYKKFKAFTSLFNFIKLD